MITIQYVQEEDIKPYSNLSTVTFEIDGADSTVDDLLQSFDYFIKAIGYHPEGCLQYVVEQQYDLFHGPIVLNPEADGTISY